MAYGITKGDGMSFPERSEMQKAKKKKEKTINERGKERTSYNKDVS